MACCSFPPTGDWADEYIQSGYVLYDQLLYLQTLRCFSLLHKHLHDSSDHQLEERIARLTHLIRANYWFVDENEETPDDVYHEVLYKKGRQAAPRRGGSFWMPFFSPVGYGYRFDGMANALSILLEVSDAKQCQEVDDYIEKCMAHKNGDLILLPAFNPVVTAKDEEWDDLQMTFSHTFKNAPYEYHNGGLWPLVTGFYAASLALRGKQEQSLRYCDGIHAANRLQRDGNAWSFSEYVHGRKFCAGGTYPMGWSAAAAIIAEQYAAGNRLFG